MRWLFSKRPTYDPRALDARLPHDVAAVLAATGVPRFREALPLMTVELERARRYGRVLAVAAFTVHAAPHASTNGHGSPHATASPVSSAEEPLRAAQLGSLLRELVRETDIVAFSAVLGRCTLVMPEIGEAAARQAVDRLRDQCSQRLTLPIRTEVAVFPDDGLTLEELFALLEKPPAAEAPRPALGSRQERTA